MRVLSLFDGISGAKQALEGISCDYYASEVDKYAIKISGKNHPDIVQLGDVNSTDFKSLGKFDLIIAGSPCTDLSIAKKDRKGLRGLRSSLFYKFVEAVDTIQPTYFFLENVASMSSVDREEITSILGEDPVNINSEGFTPQLRNRLYWYNWNLSPSRKPSDQFLNSILESDLTERQYSLCIDASYHKGVMPDYYFKSGAGFRRTIIFLPRDLKEVLEDGYTDRKRSYCLDANYYKGTNPPHYFKKSVRQLVFERDGLPTGEYFESMGERVTPEIKYKDYNGIGYRLLTPIECERLQGFPDNYTEGVSNTQRYKSLGNSFTVPVIRSILKGIL